MASFPSDPTQADALSLSRALQQGVLSCAELMQATLVRIHRLNPQARAIVNLRPDADLLAEAALRDAELAAGRCRGWLHGLPQAIKDTGQAAGLPTTFGSPLLAGAVAQEDSVYVARTKAAGCIVIGKTNMPELGLGSHTYNPLFGATPNAWDPALSAGGSSGGAAVALAQRLLPVADGSDFMGSLRNPAGWNHVFGLRPSQGRVPGWPRPDVFVSQLATDGPMARTVDDLARLLQTQAGHDARVPLSLAEDPAALLPPDGAAERGLRGQRIGWLADLDGYLAMEPGILLVCEAALARMADAGAQIEPAQLGFSPQALWQAWLVWRRALVAPHVAALLQQGPHARERIKPEALWEYDGAQGLAFVDFMAASQVRTAFHQQLLRLFERHDFLALPTAQTWPFALQQTWPRTVAGRRMDTYHRWMEVTIYATLGGLPAISLPAGFDASGRWPMGLQLIGPPRGDAAVLRAAKAYEARATELLARRPPPPQSSPPSPVAASAG
ncbi:MAG: amidase [Rubrivivax sp.]|nr:amidase [Rubrivivax sp.]